MLNDLLDIILDKKKKSDIEIITEIKELLKDKTIKLLDNTLEEIKINLKKLNNDSRKNN